MGAAFLLVGMMLAQPSGSTVAVALSSGRPGAEPYAATVLTRVRAALSSEGLAELLSTGETRKRLAAAGFADSRKCAGGRRCLRELAGSLGPGAVLVGVDVARVGDDLVVHLEAVAADAEASLQVKDVTVPLKSYAEALVAPLTAFARGVRDRLPAAPAMAPRPPPESPQDTPVAEAQSGPQASPRLVPEQTPTPNDVVATTEQLEPASPGRGPLVAGVATGAAALVAGALAVTFAVLGANDQQRWQQSQYQVGPQTGTSLSAAEADALVAQGNARFSVALGTGVGAAALLAAAIVLLTR